MRIATCIAVQPRALLFSNMRLAMRLKAVDHRQQQLPWEVEEKASDASASDAAPLGAVSHCSDSNSDSEP